MTKDEMIKQIRKEERRIAHLQNKIAAMKSDINACRGAIIYWEEQIKKLTKSN